MGSGFISGSFNNIPAGTATVNNLSEMKSASISAVIADLTDNYGLTYASGCDAASLGEEADTRLALKTRLAFEAAAAGKTAFSDLITNIDSAITTTQMRMPLGAAISDAEDGAGDLDCHVWKIEVDGTNFEYNGNSLLAQALSNGNVRSQMVLDIVNLNPGFMTLDLGPNAALRNDLKIAAQNTTVTQSCIGAFLAQAANTDLSVNRPEHIADLTKLISNLDIDSETGSFPCKHNQLMFDRMLAASGSTGHTIISAPTGTGTGTVHVGMRTAIASTGGAETAIKLGTAVSDIIVTKATGNTISANSRDRVIAAVKQRMFHDQLES
jgi:hypothetical protein